MKAEEFWKEWCAKNWPGVSDKAIVFAEAYHQQRIRELDVREMAELVTADYHISADEAEAILRRKLEAEE